MVVVGVWWPAFKLAIVRLWWSALANVGCCWLVAFVGLRWLSLVVVGLHWPAMVVVGLWQRRRDDCVVADGDHACGDVVK